MSIYIIIAIIVALFSVIEVSNYLSKDTNNKTHVLLFCIFSLFLIIFVGFRECGFDYDSYEFLYEDFAMPGWIENAEYNNIEYGYAFLNHFLGNYRLVLVVMAIITISLHFTFIYKYSPLPFLSVLFLLGVILYPSIMGQYRQSLAIGIVLWAFVDRKNKLKFFSIIFLASLFHASSLICLLVYFLPDKLFKVKTYITALIVALILNFSIKSYVLSLSSLLPTLMSEKVDIYSSTEDYVLGLNLAMLLRIIIFFIFIWYKDMFTTRTNGSLYINIYFLSLLIYLALGSLPQIAGRGGIYFYYFEFILMSILIYNFRGFKRYLFFILFMALSVWRQISFFVEWSGDYIPYYNVLFK